MSSHDAASAKPKTKKVPMPEGGRTWYILKFMECVLVISCLVILIITQYIHEVVDDFTVASIAPVNTTTTTVLPVTTTTVPKLRNEPITKPKFPTTEPGWDDNIPQIIGISKELSKTSRKNRTRRLNRQNDHLELEMTNWGIHIRINESLKRVTKVSDKKEHAEKKKKDRKCNAGPIRLNDLLIMFPCSTTLLMVIAMEILGEIFKDPLTKLSNLVLIVLAILLANTQFVISLLAYLKAAHVTLLLIAILSIILTVVEFINFILLILS